MFLKVLFPDDFSQFIHGRETEVFRVGEGEDSLAFLGIEELPIAIEQLKGVPLFGVMAGRDDDATLSILLDNRYLGSGSGSQSYVGDVASHSHEGAGNHGMHHIARDTGISPNHDPGARRTR